MEQTANPPVPREVRKGVQTTIMEQCVEQNPHGDVVIRGDSGSVSVINSIFMETPLMENVPQYIDR